MTDKLIDLQDKEYREVKKILSLCFEKEVWVFGSRVSWATNKYSDLDLVIFDATPEQIGDLKEAFEESNLLFTVDILSWENIPDDFKNNIKKKYVVIQQAKKDLKIVFETNFKETEIGRVPKDWEVKEIGEIGEVKSGGTPSTLNNEFWNGNISWITPKDISNFNSKYILKGERNITKKGLENSSAVLIPKNSIIFSTRAPIGYIKITKKELSTNQGFKNIIVKKENDFNFIFYILKKNKRRIENLAGGSTFKEFTGTQMKNLKIPLPPTLVEQKAISKILSDLDEKIENNKRQNEILEEIGKSIFKRWFIDFEFENEEGLSYKLNGGRMIWNEELEKEIPYGWEVGRIGDLICEINKKVGTKKEINVLSAINIGELIKSQDYFKKQVFSKELNKYKKIKKYNFAYNPARINIGSIGMLKDLEFGAVSPVYITFSIRENYHWFFEKILKSNQMKKQIQILCSGGVRQILDFKGFKDLIFLIPNEKIVLKFNKIYEKNLQIIRNNILENQKLTNLRDYLLPKLMKGEIRIFGENG